MPPQGLIPPREAPHGERTNNGRGAISRVRTLLSRPTPWPEDEIRRAAESIRELQARYERFIRSDPDVGEIEPSPYFESALEALKAALETRCEGDEK
ncbi:MAG: hypothetical protein O6952_07945 [Planctomycetota bacterium]|nr:hypothetical protein [Planctomycetota bacterium]